MLDRRWDYSLRFMRVPASEWGSAQRETEKCEKETRARRTQAEETDCVTQQRQITLLNLDLDTIPMQFKVQASGRQR